METATRHLISLFVDKASRQWVVRDKQGQFWTAPATEGGWKEREPYLITEDTQLEPAPGHYLYALGVFQFFA